MMKPVTVVISLVALAGLLASPADAAGQHKHKHAAQQPAKQQQVDATPTFQGGVRKGPLYNGPDYLGDDPDPGIRAYLLKDMTRYQGSY
jgi:hypothetical protein